MVRADTSPLTQGITAPLQVFELVVQIQPEDIFGGHVNIARLFAYITETFNRWYAAMDLHTVAPGSGPQMAHLAYDFLREMHYPGAALCRITVTRLGTSSLEHSIELRDANDPEKLCGRGKSVHVWVDENTLKPGPWPAAQAAKCWVKPTA